MPMVLPPGADPDACIAQELTKSAVSDQIQLVKEGGLLGKGATAYVFKCVWPTRFGTDKLLACKVLKDGYDADIQVLQSFTYEATVLASLE
jgi:predicted Ser/Thr protein kinase